MKKPEIEIAFRIGRHQQDRIISTEGILPTIPAGHHLNAQWMNLILVYEETDTDKHRLRGQLLLPQGGLLQDGVDEFHQKTGGDD